MAKLYRPGFSYAKAEVMLLELCQRHECTMDLFTPDQPARTEQLMTVLDQVNARWGRGTLHPARLKVKAKAAAVEGFLSYLEDEGIMAYAGEQHCVVIGKKP
ncbi:DUF4113 domain-containing protein [Pseudomonas sp. TMP25]|uniref:DUF4113 domain-containing protein n=1 Tax=Pseudomonas sp. TMP25 TaxID=3136561 RepID=UPI003101B35D